MSRRVIYVVRHGETEENREHIIQGQLDTKLNGLGIEQAKKTANALKAVEFDVVYASSLERAVHTAEEIVAGRRGLEVTRQDALRERHMGEKQGKRYDPSVSLDKTAEAVDAFQTRILNWWDEMTASSTAETVLVVGHGAWIGRLLGLLVHKRGYGVTDGLQDGELWFVKNCSIQLIEVDDEQRGWVRRWGDVDHLESSLAENVDSLA
ncbi:phosphoglycerate mutase-like protein [Sistotremastrum suecicum HHB10207 ss-3]|uniref:Phosphoglycerate mutase-like protein n=1 Tax=Sistotremastrum suecicum HHB10207 ss-3 TaxID=1314776 RepID=A0A166E6Y6_9AGAM|nr:phosphoglycerate mutase-like protein [Sistotremastrum suecicum HHB10207 ss-3]